VIAGIILSIETVYYMHMRTTIALDDELVKQAEYYTGIKEKAALVRSPNSKPAAFLTSLGNYYRSSG
jgi:Bacterial antitoxin of type II TA system, VapB